MDKEVEISNLRFVELMIHQLQHLSQGLDQETMQNQKSREPPKDQIDQVPLSLVEIPL